MAVTTAPTTTASSITVSNSGASLGLAGNTSSVNIQQDTTVSALVISGAASPTISGGGSVENVTIKANSETTGEKTIVIQANVSEISIEPENDEDESVSAGNIIIGGSNKPNITVTEKVSVKELVVEDEAAPNVTVNGTVQTVLSVSNSEDKTTISGSGNVNEIKAGDNTSVTTEQLDNAPVIEEIEQLQVVVSFESGNQSKTYGDPSFINLAGVDIGGGKITYSSSDKSVATVNSATGEVIIVGIGETDITAKSAQSAEYKSGKASYTLTVAKKALTVTGITAVYTPAYTAGAGTAAPEGTAVLSGLVPGDDVTLGGTPSASFTDVSAEAAVTITGYGISGEDAGKYSFTQPVVNTIDTTAVRPKTPIVISDVTVLSATSVKVTMDDLGLVAGDFTITGGDGNKTVSNAAYNAGAYTLTVDGYLKALEAYNLTISNGEAYADASKMFCWDSGETISSPKNFNDLQKALLSGSSSVKIGGSFDVPAGAVLVVPGGVTLETPSALSNPKTLTIKGSVEILGTLYTTANILGSVNGLAGDGYLTVCGGGVLKLGSKVLLQGMSGKVSVSIAILTSSGECMITGEGHLKMTPPSVLSIGSDTSLTIDSGVTLDLDNGSNSFIVKGNFTVEENAILILRTTNTKDAFRFGWPDAVLSVNGTLEVCGISNFNEYADVQIGADGTLIINDVLNMKIRSDLPEYHARIAVADGGRIENRSDIICDGTITGESDCITGGGSISGGGTWPGKQ